MLMTNYAVNFTISQLSADGGHLQLLW